MIASGGAHGALAPGLGSRARPVPGGVLVQDPAGTLLGAVGLSGETSGHGELAAVADIEVAGSQAQPDRAVPQVHVRRQGPTSMRSPRPRRVTTLRAATRSVGTGFRPGRERACPTAASSLVVLHDVGQVRGDPAPRRPASTEAGDSGAA